MKSIEELFFDNSSIIIIEIESAEHLRAIYNFLLNKLLLKCIIYTHSIESVRNNITLYNIKELLINDVNFISTISYICIENNALKEYAHTTSYNIIEITEFNIITKINEYLNIFNHKLVNKTIENEDKLDDLYSSLIIYNINKINNLFLVDF